MAESSVTVLAGALVGYAKKNRPSAPLKFLHSRRPLLCCGLHSHLPLPCRSLRSGRHACLLCNFRGLSPSEVFAIAERGIRLRVNEACAYDTSNLSPNTKLWNDLTKRTVPFVRFSEDRTRKRRIDRSVIGQDPFMKIIRACPICASVNFTVFHI